MLRIGGVMFFLGLVTLGNGAIFIWRSQLMQSAQIPEPILARRSRQFRDAGVVIATAGVIILLGSFLIIVKRGF